LSGSPSAIIEDKEKGFRYFQAHEGPETYLIAQRIFDSESTRPNYVQEKLLRQANLPPLQDPAAPVFKDAERLKVGPWTRSQHKSLEEVEEYYAKVYVNPDNLEKFNVLLVRVDSDEYEYALNVRTGEVWARTLTKQGA